MEKRLRKLIQQGSTGIVGKHLIILTDKISGRELNGIQSICDIVSMKAFTAPTQVPIIIKLKEKKNGDFKFNEIDERFRQLMEWGFIGFTEATLNYISFFSHWELSKKQWAYIEQHFEIETSGANIPGRECMEIIISECRGASKR